MNETMVTLLASVTTKQAIYLNHAKKLICYIGRPYGLVFVTRLKQVGFFVSENWYLFCQL